MHAFVHTSYKTTQVHVGLRFAQPNQLSFGQDFLRTAIRRFPAF
jgi:hypothetical protein